MQSTTIAKTRLESGAAPAERHVLLPGSSPSASPTEGAHGGSIAARAVLEPERPRGSAEHSVYPPETIEGWYVYHQIYTLDRVAMREVSSQGLESMQESAIHALREIAAPKAGGWSAVIPLMGSKADVMLLHFRPTLDDIGAMQRRVAREPLFDLLRPVNSFLSMTEAGLYNVTADLAREAKKRGGAVHDEEYELALAERLVTERSAPHVKRRLFPTLPAEMPYASFYPMSKRRHGEHNWYALPLEERSKLMRSHGLVGRRYAGRVAQIVTGAIGLDSWEWGVTLFATDPLDFKRLVTDMRFQEMNSRYAEFGESVVGRVTEPEHWVATLM